MTCEACATARARRGHFPELRAGCHGCAARALSRSHAAIDAFEGRPRDETELREALRRIFPTTPTDVALASVCAWWAMDHAKEVTP